MSTRWTGCWPPRSTSGSGPCRHHGRDVDRVHRILNLSGRFRSQLNPAGTCVSGRPGTRSSRPGPCRLYFYKTLTGTWFPLCSVCPVDRDRVRSTGYTQRVEFPRFWDSSPTIHFSSNSSQFTSIHHKNIQDTENTSIIHPFIHNRAIDVPNGEIHPSMAIFPWKHAQEKI